MTRALRITFSARAVIARGFAFSPRAGSFADADVALDEISSLPPPPEPLVLRVTATGGDAAERARVEGDWLCDGTLGEPRRIPAPAWSYSEEAAAWTKRRPWLEAWETCKDARWMLHAAASVGVDRRLVVRAACACARTVLDRIPAGEERPRRAIETAEAWTRAEASAEEVRRAVIASAMYASAVSYASAASAAASAADVASTVYAADAIYAAVANATLSAAAYATAGNAAADAADAADAAANAASAAGRRRTLARFALLVRNEISTLSVLRAVAGVRSGPRT